MNIMYKVRLYPSKKQVEQFQRNFNACKWVYNYFLERKRAVFEETQHNYSLKDCDAELSKKRKEFEWLSKADTVALQNYIRVLDEEFRAYIRNTKTNKEAIMPHYIQSCCEFTTNVDVLSSQYIKIPKTPVVKCLLNKETQGRPVSCTVRYENGRYDALLECTDVPTAPLPKTNKSITINDDNLCLLTEEDEDFFIKSETLLKRLEKRIKKLQYGSRNYQSVKKRINNCYIKSKNRFNDIIHKYTTGLLKEYDIVVIENISNKELYAKIVSQLQYKAKYYEKTVIIQKKSPSTE